MSVKLDNLNYPLFSLELKLANLKIVSVVRVLFFGLNSHDQTKNYFRKERKISLSIATLVFQNLLVNLSLFLKKKYHKLTQISMIVISHP